MPCKRTLCFFAFYENYFITPLLPILQTLPASRCMFKRSPAPRHIAKCFWSHTIAYFFSGMSMTLHLASSCAKRFFRCRLARMHTRILFFQRSANISNFEASPPIPFWHQKNHTMAYSDFTHLSGHSVYCSRPTSAFPAKSLCYFLCAICLHHAFLPGFYIRNGWIKTNLI